VNQSFLLDTALGSQARRSIAGPAAVIRKTKPAATMTLDWDVTGASSHLHGVMQHGRAGMTPTMHR